MKRLVLAVIILIAALAYTIPPASADLEGEGAIITDAAWTIPCNSGDAEVTFNIYVDLPAGYTLKIRTTATSASEGIHYTHEDQMTVPAGEYFEDDMTLPFSGIPSDGSFEFVVEVLAPSGLMVTSSALQAECPSGRLFTPFGQIYDMVPLPEERVMGHVLADTPLYTEANPATVRSEVLTAGQTWFVVGQVTGTDDMPWYMVFVGSWDIVYVPASTMTLDGPVPESEWATASAPASASESESESEEDWESE